MEEVVGEHEVGPGLGIDGETEVVTIGAGEVRVETVMVVEHRHDTIETETIEAVLFYPPTQI